MVAPDIDVHLPPHSTCPLSASSRCGVPLVKAPSKRTARSPAPHFLVPPPHQEQASMLTQLSPFTSYIVPRFFAAPFILSKRICYRTSHGLRHTNKINHVKWSSSPHLLHCQQEICMHTHLTSSTVQKVPHISAAPYTNSQCTCYPSA